MTHNIPHLANCLVTEHYRTKAQIKYELNYLEHCLNKHLTTYNTLEYSPAKLNSLCDAVADKYLDYLKVGGDKLDVRSNVPMTALSLHWPKQADFILNIKKELTQAPDVDAEKKLIIALATLYREIKFISSQSLLINAERISYLSDKDLNKLTYKNNLSLWLTELIDFWNHHETNCMDLSMLFCEWKIQQHHLTFDFFSALETIQLANAIFFYKLYPAKLFNILVRTEKLVSIRMRLGVLHHYIELMQKQLNSLAEQYGLKPALDYLFHGEDLPQGIFIEVDSKFSVLIQTLIKQIKITVTPENEQQTILEPLYDLRRAYKFWFNPNRLIDAVMVLQQRLVKENTEQEGEFFQQKMRQLYSQLTTTECLDLYGYFANDDSRYLVYTFFIIKNGAVLDWLPKLNKKEKNIIHCIFSALKSAMEALRLELKNRSIATEPYNDDLAKYYTQTGKRNRDAIFRVLAIYTSDTKSNNSAIDELFQFIEDLN